MTRSRCAALTALLLCATAATALHASGGVWTQLAPAVSPAPRTLAAFVYDSAGDRFIGFGGSTASLENLTFVCPASNPGDWSVLATTGSRPARLWNTSVYDPVRNRVLCFGAADSNGNALIGVYQLTLSDPPTWSEIPAGGIPPALTGHSLVYDPLRDRLLVFGGSDGVALQNTVREVSLTSGADWDVVATTGTPPNGRLFSSAVYDPSGDRLIVFGGHSTTGYKNDCWALSLSGSPAWTQLAPIGTPPGVRRKFAYAYDDANDRLVVQGGQISSGTALGDTWALSLGALPAWTRLAPLQNGPPGRLGHTGAYDPARGRFVMFGGHDSEDLEECATFSLAAGAEAWLELESATAHPRARGVPIGAIDDRRSRWVVADPVQLWSLSLGDKPRWTPLYPMGTPPAPVQGRSVTYDPVQDRLLFFGGATSAGVQTNELWQLSFASGEQWTQLAPTGALPPARSYHTATFDPTRWRMLVFGGGGGQNDLWSLSLGAPPAWLQIVPEGVAPPPGLAYERAIVYDPIGDRLVILGAYDYYSADSVTTVPFGSEPPLWVRPNTSPYWEPLSWEVRSRMVAYDSQRRRVLEFGGVSVGDPDHRPTEHHLIGLSLDSAPEWSVIVPGGISALLPGVRHAGAFAYDATHDRALLFGGRHYSPYWFNVLDYSDTWVCDFPAVTGVGDGPEPPMARLALRITPNPLRYGGVVRLSLPTRGPGSLEVLDLAGRLVARRDLSALPPGTHTFSLDEMDALPAGIYFARVTSGGERANVRVCKLR